jgi:hypothetical protein
MAKGSKILNPADKARKEARKKELKKNKKQRQQVRSAAIECRDPHQIIAELEHIDSLEFNIENRRQQTSDGYQISETLYKDKRKRLKELYAKILAHYEKEDAEKHAKLRALEAVYEAKHKRAQREFEAVKAAQEVRIEDVFLPPDQSDANQSKPLKETAIVGDPSSAPIKQPPPHDKHTKNPPLPKCKSIHFLPASQRNRVVAANEAKFNQSSKPVKRQPTGAGQLHVAADLSPKQGANNSNKAKVDDQPTEQSKPAVIESKPVIFMPKVTKFVPASVRAKLGTASSSSPSSSSKK